MKILITGGAGFIGSHLCEKYTEENHTVLCLDNFTSFCQGEMDHINLFLIKGAK